MIPQNSRPVWAASAALVSLLAGCKDNRAPRILCGGLTQQKGQVAATLYLDRAAGPNARVELRFDPQPVGQYRAVFRESPPSVEIRFDHPRPFPPGAPVTVSVRSPSIANGKPVALRWGLPPPVLSEARWRDGNANRLVDFGDSLALTFTAPVVVGAPGGGPVTGELLSGEFLLPEGEDRLGTYQGGAVPLRSEPGSPTEVILSLGHGAFLRPAPPGEAGYSRLGFNATAAAPSCLIRGAQSGLGAVAPAPDGSVPIYCAKDYQGLLPCGKAQLGPGGAHEGAALTVCQKGNRVVAVLSGGRDRSARPDASGDVFAFSLAEPGELLFEGRLTYPRYGHAAVAIPVPPDVPLLACVLVVGGIRAFGRPLPPPELICVGENGSGWTVVVQSRAGEPPSGHEIVMRVGTRGVFVPSGRRAGFAVVSGGESARTGSVEVFRVEWRSVVLRRLGGRPVPVVQELGTFFPAGFPPRRDHTLTAFAFPNGTWGAFLYGGRVGDTSVGLPFVIEPEKLSQPEGRRSFVHLIAGYVEEERFVRHGHEALFVPGLSKVIALGGIRSLSQWDQWGIPIDEAVQFDPATQRVQVLSGTVHQYRVDPSLAVVPGTDMVFVAGGRDRTGKPLRTLDVYVHPRKEGAGAHLAAVAASVPGGGRRRTVLTCAGAEKHCVFLLDPQGGSTWKLCVGSSEEKKQKKSGNRR